MDTVVGVTSTLGDLRAGWVCQVNCLDQMIVDLRAKVSDLHRASFPEVREEEHEIILGSPMPQRLVPFGGRLIPIDRAVSLGSSLELNLLQERLVQEAEEEEELSESGDSVTSEDLLAVMREEQYEAEREARLEADLANPARVDELLELALMIALQDEPVPKYVEDRTLDTSLD